MGTMAISHQAFFDEMLKIAEAKKDKEPFMTKGKVKKLLTTVVPATALGLGLGYGGGKLISRYARPAIRKGIKARSRLKYAPMVAGGIAGLGGGLAMMHRSKASKALDEAK